MKGVPTDMEELAIKYQKAETRLKEVETLNEELQLKLVEPLRSAGVSKVIAMWVEPVMWVEQVMWVEPVMWMMLLSEVMQAQLPPHGKRKIFDSKMADEELITSNTQFATENVGLKSEYERRLNEYEEIVKTLEKQLSTLAKERESQVTLLEQCESQEADLQSQDEMKGVPTDMEELAIKYQKAETRLKEVETLNEELQLKLVEPLRSAGVSKVIAMWVEPVMWVNPVMWVEPVMWMMLLSEVMQAQLPHTGKGKFLTPRWQMKVGT
ncbi:hypothetical protein EB796_005193 [Bugula neritina]|uniref:Uncharacterized protein n=1 Tax=Bugula neritina TaxID=10212 RepID=A0A7J7KCX5_BUGNE|nr:hypothetical protein EB796_005193 [Bugula neritina]